MKHVDYERRVVSFLIDLGFSTILATIVLSIIGILIKSFTLTMAIQIIFPSICLAMFIYLTFSYRLFKGNTIGGRICNVKIVNVDGTNLRIKTCLIRAALLSLLILLIYNVFYMFLLRTQVSFYDEATSTRAIQVVPTEY